MEPGEPAGNRPIRLPSYSVNQTRLGRDAPRVARGVGMSYSVRAPFASKMPIRFVPTSVNTSRPLPSSREIARGRLPGSGTFSGSMSRHR